MKYLLYIGILLAVILSPIEGTDVGKLLPVEVIALSETYGMVTVDADTGDQGTGRTVDEAIGDMKSGASGLIYLDTVEYLLLEEGMESYLDAVEGHLKKSVRLCYTQGDVPIEGVADFLSVHRPNVTLGTVSDYGSIPTITEENGRYHLNEK